MKKPEYIDSWDPFDLRPRTRARQGLYVGATWGILGWALLLLFLALTVQPAKAETWAVATVRSYHHDRNKEHVEANWGLGLEHKLSQDWAVTGGFYRNSYGDHSNYGGIAWMPLHYGYFHFGVATGLVTGYDKPVGAYFIPSMAIQNKHVGLNIGVVPSLSDAYTVIGVQVKWRFK